MGKRRQGFTLIELLIVVAIIGILAAIAVPNFLNAQLRARLAQMQTDLKALGNSLLIYRMDNKCYFDNTASNPYRELRPLTTPMPYITAIPNDPFRRPGNTRYQSKTAHYDYTAVGPKCRDGWKLHGLGPDKDEDAGSGGYGPTQQLLFRNLLYNMSNGLSSSGDVIYNSWSNLSF